MSHTDRRRYRALAAERLAERLAGLAVSRTGPVALRHPGARVDWATLESLPHWCLLEDADRLQLQNVAGALFLLPLWRGCIDGGVLRIIRQQIGDLAFDRLLDDPPALDRVAGQPGFTDDPGQALRGAGAAVLLGTLAESLRPLFTPLTGDATGSLAQATADRLYLRAAALLESGPSTARQGAA